jgi:hypothetical protein
MVKKLFLILAGIGLFAFILWKNKDNLAQVWVLLKTADWRLCVAGFLCLL